MEDYSQPAMTHLQSVFMKKSRDPDTISPCECQRVENQMMSAVSHCSEEFVLGSLLCFVETGSHFIALPGLKLTI